MVAVADTEALYCLAFTEQPDIVQRMQVLAQRANAEFCCGTTPLLTQLEAELDAYFAGNLQQFTIPCTFIGTAFQQDAWRALQNIAYGSTVSYQQQAQWLNRPTAFRAVAHANAANMIAIVVPCHRVIKKDGDTGGYNGGIANKRYLLNHEKYYKARAKE